ncbi:MAG TPA: 1-acyl-sn-glycerol-3-phosphate acyltransferase [Thermoanaerobaculia bacterium]
MIRSALVFAMLVCLKYASRFFYRQDFQFIEPVPENPWADLRLVAFLNHTSLFEPVFLGAVPNSFIWRLAAHGVIPAADKTTGRPLVGIIFKFIAHHVVPITRERDETWFKVLSKIDPQAMVVIAPEGRMKRANGLDANGKPMTVRGGIADILLAVKEGPMLLAYSGGLHHVQVPGHPPRIFKTVRLRVENLEIRDYIAERMAEGGEEAFKKNVIRDLERRRDLHSPEEHKLRAARSVA